MTDKSELEILNTLRDEIVSNNIAKGFRAQMFEGLTPEQIESPIGQKLAASIYAANLHGETSELWEAFRDGKLHEPCDKAAKLEAAGLPVLSCAEEEIADVIIRALDTAEGLGIDVAKAVFVKMAYNATRPALHGGKKA
jgi:NTP pyrophosphatase (non-canonical NTP hydrolase)